MLCLCSALYAFQKRAFAFHADAFLHQTCMKSRVAVVRMMHQICMRHPMQCHYWQLLGKQVKSEDELRWRRILALMAGQPVRRTLSPSQKMTVALLI